MLVLIKTRNSAIGIGLAERNHNVTIVSGAGSYSTRIKSSPKSVHYIFIDNMFNYYEAYANQVSQSRDEGNVNVLFYRAMMIGAALCEGIKFNKIWFF